MADKKLITLGTTATSTEADAVAAMFHIDSAWFRHGIKPSIYLEGLTGVETVTLWLVNVDEDNAHSALQVYDENQAAAQLDFANNKTTITFNSPGWYGVTHSDLGAERDLFARYD